MEDGKWEDINQEDISPRLQEAKGTDHILVIDVTGVYFLKITYCICLGSGPNYLQLLNSGLFPVPLQNPKMAFTFNVLDDCLQDNLECGTSRMNYFSKLKRITSNIFSHLVPVSDFAMC